MSIAVKNYNPDLYIYNTFIPCDAKVVIHRIANQLKNELKFPSYECTILRCAENFNRSMN